MNNTPLSPDERQGVNEFFAGEMGSKAAPLSDSETGNLLSLLDYDKKLAAMSPRQLIFEVMGSKACDYRCVVALMDRVLPNWNEEFSDEETETGVPSVERFEPILAPVKPATPPTPAGAEELAAARECEATVGRWTGGSLQDSFAAIIARHFQPLRDLHQRCRNSVVEASLAFPNVGSYIAQIEDARIAYINEMAKLHEELTRASRKSISQEEQLKALTKADCGFGGCIDCLVGDNAALREEVERLKAQFTPNGALARENEKIREEVERWRAVASAREVWALNEKEGSRHLREDVAEVRTQLTAAEARCKELEEVLHLIVCAPTFDFNSQAIVDLARNMITAARQRKD